MMVLNTEEAAVTIPLIDVLPDIGKRIEDLTAPFFSPQTRDINLFADMRRALIEPRQADTDSKALDPTTFKGTPRELLDAFISVTPFEKIFTAQLPFIIPEETRFGGHWIIAPPGRGKTTLLHSMIMEDLRKDAAVILMDSKGDLIEPIRDLKQIEDRLIIVDPDPDHPIAFNPLDIPNAEIRHAVDFLEYLFGSLLEFKMTPLQTTLFRSVFRALVIAFPSPTLETFRDILANGYEKYLEHINRLPPDLQEFFFKEFNDKVYTDRRREVIQRIRLLLENDTMRAMLLASRTRFNIREAMDSGKVIIINNSKARLGDQGAEFFGRFFIAQALAAAQQRAGRRQEQKKPVYFYIDECQNVISRDEKIPTILDECRSQKIALILAHQRTTQITSSNVLDALANCAIRFTNSDDEARMLAPKLRTTPEYLQSLKRGQFAAFVRDMTSQAVTFQVSKTDFSKLPKLSPNDRAALKAKMQAAYGVIAEPTPSAKPSIAPPPTNQPPNPVPTPQSAEPDSQSQVAVPTAEVAKPLSVPAGGDPHAGDHTNGPC